jgi:tRNA G18 (ribose-2'-O)-methylase SpoU
MQAQGYTIVAVEQTVNSQNLYDYQFPEKTLLLLGYTKLGLCLN